MNKKSIAALMLCIVIAVVGLAACGDDGGSVNVAGTWAGQVNITFDDSSHLSDNVILVLSQSGTTVTGQITNSGGTLSISGEAADDSLAINFTVPCNGGKDPKIAALTFNVSGSTMDITSGSNLACTKTISTISGMLTKQ